MDFSVGLSEREAAAARFRFGRNELPRKSKVVAARVFINQLKSPLVYVLLIAAVVNVFLRETVDAAVIMAAVIVNAILGFTQEYQAERSLELLDNLITPTAKVKRGKEWQEIAASGIVPGDVVRLEVGQRIPADGVLTRADGLYVNEALLSGESFPVDKKQFIFEDGFTINKFQIKEAGAEHKCFMGTTVDRGIGEMLVINTGMQTSLGHIAKDLTKQTPGKTPLQIKLAKLANRLVLLVALIIPVMVAVGVATGKGLDQIFLVGTALAVSAIPEGLAVGLTVILTVGMRRILARKALVRKLTAAETLGSIDFICLDKTGTLTEGKMKTVGAVTDVDTPLPLNTGAFSPNLGANSKELLIIRGAILCNDERDPLEVAMMEWASPIASQSGGQATPTGEWKRVATLPFDHRYKYIVTRHKNKKGEMLEYISGAPEVILQLSAGSGQLDRAEWKRKFGELGTKGLRIVGFGYKRTQELKNSRTQNEIGREEVGGYEWLGVISFADPVRQGAAASLANIKKANIGVKIVTGDYKETAWSVLSTAGLVSGKLDDDLVISGDQLTGADPKRIERAILFARVSPQEKLHIVKALQKLGHVVAMMGDGVNDAPALKQADIGVVVANASDVARETAELVLLDNNFETILAAVEEGRAMLVNLRKVVLYLLADSFAGVILIFLALIFNWPLPLVVTQVLWINLISDGFPYMALALEPKEPGLLARPPLRRDEPIVDRKMMGMILTISLVAGLLSLAIFGLYYFVFNQPLVIARTVTLAALGSMTLAYVFSVRLLFVPINRKMIFANRWLSLGVLGGFLLVIGVVYLAPLQKIFGTISLSWTDWGLVLSASLILLMIIEGTKSALIKLWP